MRTAIITLTLVSVAAVAYAKKGDDEEQAVKDLAYLEWALTKYKQSVFNDVHAEHERFVAVSTDRVMQDTKKLTGGTVRLVSSVNGGVPHDGQASHVGHQSTGIVPAGGNSIHFYIPGTGSPGAYISYYWDEDAACYIGPDNHRLVFPDPPGNSFVEAVPFGGTGPQMAVINIGTMTNTNP